MDKTDAEALFGSIFQRYKTGNIENFERDYSEEVQAIVDDRKFDLEDLKKRTLFFFENYEILDSKIEDFIYENGVLAVRLFAQIRRRSDEEIIEDTFHWFYEVKDNQVIKYWAITNYSFGFPDSESVKGK